jgi:hypothetical protein
MESLNLEGTPFSSTVVTLLVATVENLKTLEWPINQRKKGREEQCYLHFPEAERIILHFIRTFFSLTLP